MSKFLEDLFEETVGDDDWDEIAVETLQPGIPLTFKRDFGPWKAGMRVFRISFDFLAGEVTEWNEVGEQCASAEFILTPVE